MKTQRLRDNSIKGLILLNILIIFSVKSCIVNAQTFREAKDHIIRERVKIWEDSIAKLKAKKPLYIGGEVAFTSLQSTLISSVDRLNGLHTSFLGTRISAVVANERGKIRVSGGMYYSSPSMPYTLDIMRGGLSANLYLLRLRTIKYHTIEPYVILGITRQQLNFYGVNLLGQDPGAVNTNVNYSVSDPPLAGSISMNQISSGIGFEYQLESEKRFIHPFTEVSYVTPILWSSSKEVLAGTRLSNPLQISLGISVGIIK